MENFNALWALAEEPKCILKIKGRFLKTSDVRRLISVSSPLKLNHFQAFLIWAQSLQRSLRYNRHLKDLEEGRLQEEPASDSGVSLPDPESRCRSGNLAYEQERTGYNINRDSR